MKTDQQIIDEVNKLLANTLFTNGVFDYEAGLKRLNDFKQEDLLSLEEYLNLLDALNNYKEDRHFKNSMIYQRALRVR